MRYFNEYITEEELLKELENIEAYNINALNQYYKWKEYYYSLDLKYRRTSNFRGKPFKRDTLPSFLASRQISNELLYKYKKFVFNSNFRLERILWELEIPWDILKLYTKRILKSPSILEAVFLQFIDYQNVTEAFLVENWNLFRSYSGIKEFKKVLNSSDGYNDLKLLLRFETGE